MSRIFEYFVVCGIGPEIRSIDGNKGYHGPGWMYLPSLLDQFPPSTHSLYPPPPPQLSTCVLPAGVEFHASGFDPNDPSTFPRSYPIVLTEGDGSKIYVSCISFRDHVCEDVIEAYRIQGNSYADKCICLVSRSPCFSVLRSTLEELFVLCFSPTGSSKPLWDIIAHTVSNVPLPTPGKERVLFAIENCLLSVEAPPNCGLPHVDISFQPLVFTSNSCIRGHLSPNLPIPMAGIQSFTSVLQSGVPVPSCFYRSTTFNVMTDCSWSFFPLMTISN